MTNRTEGVTTRRGEHGGMRCIVKERVQKKVGGVIRRESDRTGAEFEKEGEVKRVGGGNAEQSEDEGSTDV